MKPPPSEYNDAPVPGSAQHFDHVKERFGRGSTESLMSERANCQHREGKLLLVPLRNDVMESKIDTTQLLQREYVLGVRYHGGTIAGRFFKALV
jgi:hypothetical protein